MSNLILEISGKKINLPASLRQKLELNGVVVVRVYPDEDVLNSYPRDEINRNVYAYDLCGRLLWQIQEAPHGGDEDKAYMNIRILEGKLVAENWLGIDYFIDFITGKVSQTERGVRPW